MSKSDSWIKPSYGQPMEAQISLRLTYDMRRDLGKIPNWQQKLRKKIQELINEEIGLNK